jgi:hypothetical protein
MSTDDVHRSGLRTFFTHFLVEGNFRSRSQLLEISAPQTVLMKIHLSIIGRR